MKRPVTCLDVFAERALAGNALAVVHEADAVGEETMHAYARETRLSETTFVQTATESGADYRNRIWTPQVELPFAGHPSLGTAVAVARRRGSDEASYTQQSGAGLQPIEVRRDGETDSGGELWRAAMLQGQAEYGIELDPAAAMRAVGLDPSDSRPELPPRVVSTGLGHAIAVVTSPEAVARTVPDYPAIDAVFGDDKDSVLLYVAWVDPETGEGRARGFSREAEFGEDPATGSAVGPLCAYVADRLGVTEIRVAQGVEMLRPSVLEARMEGGRPRVSGAVVPLIDGEIELP